MQSSTAELLDQLTTSHRFDERPWGFMRSLDAPLHDLTVKFLTVLEGQRTSLQRHEDKDELLIILSGSGHVEVDGHRYDWTAYCVRIRPGQVHRVTGPLNYAEVSTYDDGTDTQRIEDDYGRKRKDELRPEAYARITGKRVR